MVATPAPRITSPPATARRGWLIVAFALAFISTGAVHWPIPYSEVSLPNSLMGPGLIVVGLAAVLARVVGRAGFLLATVVIGAAVPAAVGARVIVDTTNDPTSHNLWPFEIVLSWIVGAGCAAAGAFAATVWSRVKRNQEGQR